MPEESGSDGLDGFYSVANGEDGTSTSDSGNDTAIENTGVSNSDSDGLSEDTTMSTTGENAEDSAGIESGTTDSGATSQSSSTTDTSESGFTQTDSEETDQSSSGTNTSESTDSSCERYVCMAHNENNPTDTDRGPMERLYAIPFEADMDHVVVGAEIVTGIKSGTNRLAIWNYSGNDPGYELSGGSWRIDEDIGWQGCDFETPVPVAEGQKFWIVWDAIGYSQATVASSGSTIYGRSSPDGGDSWETNGWKWKMRVYCCE